MSMVVDGVGEQRRRARYFRDRVSRKVAAAATAASERRAAAKEKGLGIWKTGRLQVGNGNGIHVALRFVSPGVRR